MAVPDVLLKTVRNMWFTITVMKVSKCSYLVCERFLFFIYIWNAKMECSSCQIRLKEQLDVCNVDMIDIPQFWHCMLVKVKFISSKRQCKAWGFKRPYLCFWVFSHYCKPYCTANQITRGVGRWLNLSRRLPQFQGKWKVWALTIEVACLPSSTVTKFNLV